MKNFLRDVGLDSEAGLKPAGIFRNAGIFDDAGLFISTISFLSDGYYFFDAQTLSAGNVTPWDGSLPDSPNDLGLIATQTTSGNQPTADGTVVIFDSNSEHYDIPSTSQAGWQIVGTSLGTFAYKVDSDAITELNLLGNLGGTAYRQTGDLYGIILLPDTATAAQVEAARQLLISRGAADGVTATSLLYAWRERADIVEFGAVDISTVTNLFASWLGCSSMIYFPLLNTSSVNNFQSAFYNCASLTSFPLIDVTRGRKFPYTWYNCTSIESFPAGMFDSWDPASIDNDVFNNTWRYCFSLTPQSVENILVSIAASGKYATTSGASGGTALTDPEIDIDYDGSGLTAATLTAIESLNGRGWRVKINGEIIVPNILQLQPAAAYSLRSFDADADPNVVNVRRSSDGATGDFTASEVSDGTLTSWVGGSNLITYSNAFSTQWNKTPSSTLTGGQAGYDGTNDATEFYDSKSNAAYGAYGTYSTLGINGQIIASIYVKAGTVSTGQFDLFYVGGNTVAVSFDLTAGTVEAGILGGSALIPDSVGIDNIGNGWYRINLTNNNGSTDLQYLRIGLSSAGTIFIQDAQVVYGDTVTPYVETNSSPAGNGYVTTFYDQSSNGNDSTQSTASSQPLIVDNGVLVTDSSGNPAIVGDGVDDTLAHPTLTQSLDDTDFLVTAAYENSLALGVTGGIPRLYMTQGSWSYNNLNVIGFGSQSGRNVLSFQTNGNAQEVFGNGTSLGTASEPQANFNYNMFNLMQAGSGFSSGPLMEVVVFDENQVANRAAIENNINDHFNIY